MKCPACSNVLTPTAIGDVTVEVCDHGCAGVWFDNFELSKFDEAHEGAGEQLLSVQADASVSVNQEERRNCPKCPDIVMQQHFFSVKRGVTVDECPSCGGVWLDAGELRRIRELYPTEDGREQAASDYFDELFGDELRAMQEASQQKLAAARKIAHTFRFICPSYYIPGKQEWGAF
jgi:Zn-finger nucleic acid-binding protein